MAPPSVARRMTAAVAVVGVAVSAAGLAGGIPAAAQTLSPITFTRAEADAGREAFLRTCARCHGGGLRGGEGPALVGPSFAARMGGSVGALLAFISAAMPRDDPGALSAEAFRAVVAFIAEANGLAAGPTPLPADLALLAAMGFRP